MRGVRLPRFMGDVRRAIFSEHVGSFSTYEAVIRKQQEKIAKMSREIRHWKAECGRLAAQVHALRAQRRGKEIPSKAIFHHLFHSRVATFGSLAPSPLAAAREAVLLQRSASYRRAIAVGPGDLEKSAERVCIAGLDWWVPRVRRPLDFSEGRWLPSHAMLQSREVAVGAVMIDIGANLGRTSIPRVVIGDVTAVYAAEPDPLNYACLVQTIVANKLQGLILPDQVVIGSREATARLERSPYVGGHRVLREHEQARPSREVIEVPCTTLDRWTRVLDINDAEICFIKVDTQGWELQVMLGAQRLRRQPHIAWQIEMDPDLLRRAGTSISELCTLLEQTFTHFSDLAKGMSNIRGARVGRLREHLGYLGTDAGRTDVILYSTSCGDGEP